MAFIGYYFIKLSFAKKLNNVFGEIRQTIYYVSYLQRI
jgi:hypothetical protein